MSIQYDNRIEREAQERAFVGNLACKYCVKDTINANYLERYALDQTNPFEEWRVPALQVGWVKEQHRVTKLLFDIQKLETMLELSLEGGGSIDMGKLIQRGF